MSSNEPRWATAAFRNLKGHPTETLAVVCLLVGLGLLLGGFEYYIAVGFPGAIFIVNCLMKVLTQNHERRVAEIEVQKLEKSKGAALKASAKKALDTRKRKSNDKS
jgi:hypothetical protein